MREIASRSTGKATVDLWSEKRGSGPDDDAPTLAEWLHGPPGHLFGFYRYWLFEGDIFPQGRIEIKEIELAKWCWFILNQQLELVSQLIIQPYKYE